MMGLDGILFGFIFFKFYLMGWDLLNLLNVDLADWAGHVTGHVTKCWIPIGAVTDDKQTDWLMELVK